MEIGKIIAIGLVGTIFAVLLKKENPQLAMLLAAVTGILIFGIICVPLGRLIGLLRETAETAGVGDGYFAVVLKVIGIAYLTQFGAQLCADAEDLPAAKDCLQKAVRTARRFDAEPVYTMKNIRFYHEKEPLLLSDSFGETAMQGLENSILHGTAESSQILREIWREIINESE